MFKTLKELSKYTKKHRWLAVLGAMATLLFAAFALVDPHITGQLIDHLLQGKESIYILRGLAIIMVVTIFRTLLRYVFFMSFEQYSQEIVYELRLDLYRKLQSLDFTFFDKTANGKIMSKMTGDVDAIRHFYAWITHVTIFHGSIFCFALISMFLLNPILTLLMLLIIPFILMLSLGLSKSVKPSFVKIREQFTKLNSVVQENISGNRVVRAFAREPYEIEKFEKENQAYMDRNIDSSNVWRKYLPPLDAFAVLFNVVVILVGGIFVVQEKMTIGELVAFDRLLWMINNPLRMLGWMINGTQNFVASYEKVKEMMDEESTIHEKNKAVRRERIKGNIRFDKVSFHYEDLPVLRNISFEVKSGQTLAILGATGSGKSTLISLLSRFYDVSEGKIYIDNLPIEEYDLQSLRSNISLAMQDIFLFSDTIESNIAYGNPNIPKEQIEKAS
ncbi:MAG: ABC transporter ATP-binding protein, partial [Vallitaleaceae bacterium]|nr:ABC transporter ATP-binding protein [Vallitaleaceae bacterium]